MTFDVSGGQVAMIFLVMAPVCTGLVIAAPIFGHHSLPYLVKFGLAAASRSPFPRAPGMTAGSAPLILAAPIEVIIGLSLGYILTLGFAAIELAGRVISIAARPVPGGGVSAHRVGSVDGD